MFCFPEQLFMFMLAHLLLAPLYNVPHRLTSSFHKDVQHGKNLSCSLL